MHMQNVSGDAKANLNPSRVETVGKIGATETFFSFPRKC